MSDIKTILMKYLPRIILLLLLLLISVFSCRKEESLFTNNSAKLNFSINTVEFDTVFTTIGSATKQFKIYNPYNKTIKISSIRIARGKNSNFRINIDGIASNNVNNITILAKDSLYVFVEVTVDPNNQYSPLVIKDSILFETNGNVQDVDLEAWGQNAHYIKPSFHINGLPPYSVIGCDTTWTNNLPHVVYGYAVVDSACTLIIQAGTKIYFHKNAGLWVYRGGSLKVNGTLAEPVVFQGDRLEQEYKDVPGQWDRLWINEGSKDNEINYAIIKNGFIGIQTENLVRPMGNKLILKNTIIKNMSSTGLLTRNYKVKAYNDIIVNCAQYACAITGGGNYSFNHCTLANYSSHKEPSLAITNSFKINDILYLANLDSAYFGNCIIYGNTNNEIALDSAGTILFNYKFDHCLVKVDTSIHTSNSYHFKTIYINQEPDFVNPFNSDFKLNSSSFAIDKGDIDIGRAFPTDLISKSRIDDLAPDLGAYEYRP